MKKLFSCLYGSHLYGTTTETSDKDLKHVVLPDLDDLLLGRQVKNVVKKTNKHGYRRSGPEDIDEEFIPIQVFARDFLGGQTYALELAYAVSFTKAEQKIHEPDFELFCLELRNKFLTSDIRAMVGYVVNQARLYSFKGERLNAVRAARDLYAGFPQDAKIVKYEVSFRNLADELVEKFPKYVQLTEYEINHEGDRRPCLKLLEKTLPFNNTFATNLSIVEAAIGKYGSRANDASETNVDWKATMHALRIANVGVDLLSGKGPVYPYDTAWAKYLTLIKAGCISYDVVIESINQKLDELKTLEQTCGLPKRTPELAQELEVWLLEWMYKFYGIETLTPTNAGYRAEWPRSPDV